MLQTRVLVLFFLVARCCVARVWDGPRLAAVAAHARTCVTFRARGARSSAVQVALFDTCRHHLQHCNMHGVHKYMIHATAPFRGKHSWPTCTAQPGAATKVAPTRCCFAQAPAILTVPVSHGSTAHTLQHQFCFPHLFVCPFVCPTFCAEQTLDSHSF